MDNVTIIDNDGVEWVQIEIRPNEFVSMAKSTYDELKANEAQAL